jgi:hypothetical protein
LDRYVLIKENKDPLPNYTKSKQALMSCEGTACPQCGQLLPSPLLQLLVITLNFIQNELFYPHVTRRPIKVVSFTNLPETVG